MSRSASTRADDFTIGGWEREGRWTAGRWYSLSSPSDVGRDLAPLVAHLREYDSMRQRLEKEGGCVADLGRVAELLGQKVALPCSGRVRDVTLADRPGLRQALIDIGGYDLQLDVRVRDSRMPVYYLCRIRRDYWADYSLVVEDLHRSPGYPVTDERFARLMSDGHEAYYLRLSPFREGIKTLLRAGKDAQGWEVDDALYDLGRYVFQAAWHDDQRPGILTATHFGLTRFRQAIELLYLCLSGDLCELRSALGERMFRAFEVVYPQPAIHGFLQLLAGLDGSAMSEIPRRALKLYARLLRAFGQFIETEVLWRQHRVPLYKLLFANLSRLDLVAGSLRDNQALSKAASALEVESKHVIEQIVTNSFHT